MSPPQGYDFLIKLLLIGDSDVGKSCLWLRFCDDLWPTPLPTATIGIEFKVRTIELDGKRIKLQIWDTPGLERFRSITSYYHGAMGILLVYDVTDERSFNNIRNWHAFVGQHAPEGVNKILIGNKSDWTDKRAVTEEQGRGLAEELDMKFLETSAKANEGVEEAFFALAGDCMTRLINSQAESAASQGGPSEGPVSSTNAGRETIMYDNLLPQDHDSMDNIDKLGLSTAIAKARKSYQEGGIPIGAALVYHGSSTNPKDAVVLGCAHNSRIQKSSATLHGEIAALEDAGRLKAQVYRGSTMYTTLSPCMMCTGAILLYKIPRVVIGENESWMGGEELLKSHGVEVVVLDNAECKMLMKKFIVEKPEEWNEDIGEIQ